MPANRQIIACYAINYLIIVQVFFLSVLIVIVLLFFISYPSTTPGQKDNVIFEEPSGQRAKQALDNCPNFSFCLGPGKLKCSHQLRQKMIPVENF
jgi:hypothetical protein